MSTTEENHATKSFRWICSSFLDFLMTSRDFSYLSCHSCYCRFLSTKHPVELYHKRQPYSSIESIKSDSFLSDGTLYMISDILTLTYLSFLRYHIYKTWCYYVFFLSFSYHYFNNEFKYFFYLQWNAKFLNLKYIELNI